MKGMSARIDALENLAGDSFAGEAVWLVLEPGETTEQGMARWEAKHGPLNDANIIMRVFIRKPFPVPQPKGPGL